MDLMGYIQSKPNDFGGFYMIQPAYIDGDVTKHWDKSI
jgi:hypothetical protein